MSDTDPETEELIAFFQSVFINTCCPIAVLAWLTYEFLITFDREVDLFWRRNFTGASILFLTNRYLPILVNVLNISSDASMSDSSCDSYVKALQTIQLLQYVPWAAFSSLRTFALSARNWIVTTVVLLLSIVPIGVNFTQYHWLAVVNDPIVGCTKSSTVTLETAKRLTIVSRTCLMAADLIVILVTWRTTLGTTRLNRAVLKNRPTFARMLLQDGTVYFGTLFVLNALHLAFTMFSITRDPLSPVSYFTTFTEPVTAVLVSRFLLDLQQVNQHNQKSSLSPTLTQDGTLDFAWAIGSLGSPLSNSQTSRISSLGGNADTCAYTDDAMATLWDQTELYMLEARRSLTRITVD